MADDELLTKEEIARELGGEGGPLSVRSVERYISIAKVEPAVKGSGRGKVAKYRREDVEKIVAAYRAAQESREGEGDALTTTKPAALQRVGVVAELLATQRDGFAELRAALDPWPVWMTTARALELSGLAPSWLYAGLRKGELASVGTKRTRRIHRDDLRAFAAKVADADYLKTLLEKPAKADAAGLSGKG